MNGSLRGFAPRTCQPTNRWHISNEIDAAVSSDAKTMTDESNFYANLKRRGFDHDIVIYSTKEWVRGECHTQGIDGFWSLFKRGLIGSFHQVSIKHLQRYLNEFSFRFNNRQNEEIFALVVLGLVIKTALPYKELTAKKASTSEPDFSDEPFKASGLSRLAVSGETSGASPGPRRTAVYQPSYLMLS